MIFTHSVGIKAQRSLKTGNRGTHLSNKDIEQSGRLYVLGRNRVPEYLEWI